jgi:hypothetical protein
MTDTLEPRWPQEAHPWPDEAQAYRQRMAESALARFKEANWRESAVLQASKILERMIDARLTEEQIPSQALTDALRDANLVPVSEAPSGAPDALANVLVFGALIGEAAALLLYRKTDRIVWTAVTGLLPNFDGMLVSFRMCLQLRFHDDEFFHDRFNALADQIVGDASAVPAALKMSENDRDNLLFLVERWRKAPELRSVWWGLPQMRHSYFPSEVEILANIYLALDPVRLAQLLDRFDNPYQTWTILTGFAWLGLDRKFNAWSSVFRNALPSFTDDGRWTGRTLEPLLLVIAQDALKHARLRQDAADDLVSVRQAELNSLTATISKIITEKAQGAALALRWGASLFRLCAGGTNAAQEPFPQDLRQEGTPFWRMLEALAQSDAAKGWNGIPVPDAGPDEVLCLLAAKILTARERNSALPDAEPLFRCIPQAPEDFLGDSGKATRDLIRLFSSYGARPDALKYRIMSLLFLQGDPVSLYRGYWKRTLTLRELAEHWQAGDPDDGRTDAKDALAMALAIGLTTLDYYVDSRVVSAPPFARTSEQFGELFKLVYDGLREVQAIELFNQPFWSNLHMHLLVRRALYENASVRDVAIAAPLSPDAEPTLSTMLADMAGVTQLFFDGLDALVRNGVPIERVVTGLNASGVDLTTLVDAAGRLNKIDERHPYRIETALQIAATA